MKQDVYIFGIGMGKELVKKALLCDVSIVGYIDNNTELQGKNIDNAPVYSPEEVEYSDNVIIIISIINSYREVEVQLICRGFRKEQIISFFDPKVFERDGYKRVIDEMKAREVIQKYNEKVKNGRWEAIDSAVKGICDNYCAGQKIFIAGTNEYSKYFMHELSNANIECNGVLVLGEEENPENEFLPKTLIYELVYEQIDNVKVYVFELEKTTQYSDLLLQMGVCNTWFLDGKKWAGLKELDVYDIQLGYTWMINGTPGFVRFTDGNNANAFRIVTLGGSTADPTMSNIRSWSELLYKKLLGMGINVEIAAGGVGAYTGSQELVKLIRDVIPLKPDLVISYSGFNDAYGLYHKEQHPFTMWYQSEDFERMLRSNDCKNMIMNQMPMKEVTYGLPIKKSSDEQWLDCERMMKAVCREYNIDFYCFLQPYNAEGREVFLSEYVWSQINNFYASITKNEDFRKQSDWLIDFTDIFDHESDIFFDSCHVYEKGNRIISEKMMPYILECMQRRGIKW